MIKRLIIEHTWG